MANPNHDQNGRFTSGRGGGGVAVVKGASARRSPTVVATASGKNARAVATTAGGGQHAAAIGKPFAKRHPVISVAWKVAKFNAKVNQAPKALVLGALTGGGIASEVGAARLAKVAVRAARPAAEAGVRRAALGARGGSLSYAGRSRRGVYNISSL